LIKKTLNGDIEICPKCGGKMKIIAFVTSHKEVQRYLRCEKIPIETPQFAPARGSPQYSLFDEFDGVDETFQEEYSW
jgi:ssDNA-binding Zn-finger/Zn-ribbon topoisomerase 1